MRPVPHQLLRHPTRQRPNQVPHGGQSQWLDAIPHFIVGSALGVARHHLVSVGCDPSERGMETWPVASSDAEFSFGSVGNYFTIDGYRPCLHFPRVWQILRCARRLGLPCRHWLRSPQRLVYSTWEAPGEWRGSVRC